VCSCISVCMYVLNTICIEYKYVSMYVCTCVCRSMYSCIRLGGNLSQAYIDTKGLNGPAATGLSLILVLISSLSTLLPWLVPTLDP
jgi:hypothetical protein